MLVRLALAVLLAFVALNGALLVVARTSGLGKTPVDIQTRGIYEQRLAQVDPHSGRNAVVVGDSVVFGAHLASQHGARWPLQALPGQIERELAQSEGQPMAVLNLGINGLLFRDLRCVAEDVLALRPDVLFINVSPRPFASDFQDDEASAGRAFVCTDGGLLSRVDDAMRRAIPVLRYRDVWQFEWLGTTPRAFARDHISTLLLPRSQTATKSAANQNAEEGDEEEEDDDAYVASLMWRFRAAQRLNSIQVDRAHPQAKELDALLETIRSATTTRVVVFYLHEDEDALAGQLDLEHFRKQRTLFARWVAQGVANTPQVRFFELAAQEFRGHYVDHVHLTAQGYAVLAKRLIRALPSLKPNRAASH